MEEGQLGKWIITTLVALGLAMLAVAVSGASLMIVKNVGATEIEISVKAPTKALGTSHIRPGSAAWFFYWAASEGSLSIICRGNAHGSGLSCPSMPGQSHGEVYEADGCKSIRFAKALW